MNYPITKRTIIAGLFACLASGSVQAITWKEYVEQNGVPKVVDGELDLSWKGLEDIDFADIQDKESITHLYLGNNQLQSLPKEIGQCKNLRCLFLSHNQLQVLPVEIGQLGKLQQLHLFGNKLQSLPPTFSKLTVQNCGLSPEKIKELQKAFMCNLKGFILQAIRENKVVNVCKFTRSILDRCELSPCDFKDEQGNNLLHLAIQSNMHCEGENETWKVRDSEWKILKELIACNVNNSVAKMLQEEDEQGNTPLLLLLGKDVGVFKQVFKAGRLKTPPSLLQICTQFLQDNDVDVKQALGSAVLLPEACGGHRDEKNEGRGVKRKADEQATINDGKMEEL